MPHLYQTWEEMLKESQSDPTWNKAVRRFYSQGMSLKEVQKQHQAWKSRAGAVTQVMSKSESKE